LYDPKNTQNLIQEYIRESEGSGFEILTKQVNSIDAVYRAVRDFRPQIDCLMIIPDQTVYSLQSVQDILLFCLRENLPVAGLSSKFVKAGALFSLSCDYKELGKKSGELAVRIFNGAKPSDIPYENPEKHELSLNLIVAERIGVTIPKELIEEADNVYK
jgi:putative ABC transport system substrate-binding protein